jgi:hypothetical protein
MTHRETESGTNGDLLDRCFSVWPIVCDASTSAVQTPELLHARPTKAKVADHHPREAREKKQCNYPKVSLLVVLRPPQRV